jgi:hypothetical protein
MIRNIFIVIVVPILLSFIYLYLAMSNAKTTIPQRNNNIPSSAVWSGGPVGGAWYDCNYIKKFDYSCTIYNEYTGEVEGEGEFELKAYYSDKALKKAVYVDIKDVGKNENLSFDRGSVYFNGKDMILSGMRFGFVKK